MVFWSRDTLGGSAESLERVLRPISEATGLPNEAYTSEAFAAYERDQALAKSSEECLPARTG